MKVPFADLKIQYNALKTEIDQAIQDVIEQVAFIGGGRLHSFERNFSALLGIKHCIGVANGTDAIYIILKMLGIKDGDEVITVANSWISSSETITQAGAIPVFVDVDDYFTIDVDKIDSRITKRTKAIVPVHLYGQPANIEALLAISQKYDLPIIEDCAQSHFSQYRGHNVGTFGIASTFSFYPGKNLGAYGDAGAIVTNDDTIAEKCRMYANHGSLKKHQHQMEGINSRLDGLQAAILDVKLRYILEWNEMRIRNASIYQRELADMNDIELPTVRDGGKHTYHVYAVKARHRDELKEYLSLSGVETLIHYPTPLPFLPCYAYLGHRKEDFPKASENQNLILSLPMFPELTEEQVVFVCRKIREFYQGRGR